MAETPTMEVRARLTAETAQFTKGMQQASSSMEQFTQNSARLRAAMTGIGVASAAATTAIIGLGVKSFMAAARVDELDVAMNAVGESTGMGYQAIRDAALAIKDNGIEMEIAQKSAIKFAQNNLKLSYASDLARAAQDLAVVSAKNSSETFDMLTHAVITGRSEVLKSVGIQKSAGQMYEAYAKTLGKTAQALTYQEKQQAVATGALEEAKNVAGAYLAAMQSPVKVLRSFARITNEIQVSLGGMLLKGIGPIIFHMYEFYKSMGKALERSVAFRTVMEALKQVIIKITAPITNFFIKMKSLVDGLTQVTAAAGEVKANFDPVGQSVKDLASKIEFMLPAVAALAAVFATFAGAQVFGGLPIIGRLLGMLSGPIGLVVIGLTTLFFTSNQIKDAMTNLFSALSPLIGVVAALGQSLANAAGYGVSILAVGINALATVIRTTITFLRENRIVLMALTSVLVGIAGAMLFFKIQTLAAAAATKYSNFVTGLKIRFLNAQAVADAKATFAQAQSTFATRAKTLATVQAIAVERQLAVAQAMSNLATIKSLPASAILGSKRVAVATATAALATAERGLTVATAQVTAAQSAATVASNTLAAAQARLALATSAVALPLMLKIVLIGALVAAFVIAWKNSETFREKVTEAINFVAKIVGKAVGFIMRAFAYYLKGIAYLTDENNAFGRTVAAVFEFILDTIIEGVLYFLKYYKYMADSFLNTAKAHSDAAKLIFKVFEFIARYIGAAITYTLLQYALMIKGIATLVYYFGVLKDWVGEKWSQMVEAIGRGTEGISKVFGSLGTFISGIISFMKEKFSGFIDFLVTGLEQIPYLFRGITGNLVLSQLKKLQTSLRDTSDEVEKFEDIKSTNSLSKNITDAVSNINKGITSVSNVLIQNVREFGNYEGGVAGTLSNVANKIVNVAQKVTDFAGNVTGEKMLDGLVAGAEKTSKTLGDTIAMIEGIKDKDVFKSVLKVVSSGASTASEWLLATAATVESFTNEDFVAKAGGAISNLMDGLKTGLGFGDIIGDLQKEFSLPKELDKDKNAEAIEAQTKRADAVREAMQSAIDSIKNVLDDLKNAARDFADSLKDTIVGFAGLKSIELPDGFIPKAKSLIDNMNQRLNKSLQFASQIQQLQNLELDAGALRDIIEAGPIKGAQLASSILTGDAKANISQINALQRAITFSGAAIGQMGADAAYGGLIANAQSKYASMANASLTTGMSGTVQNIQQGAFQINIDTKGAANTEEQIKMITDKIQETFAILARELAAK